MAPVEEGQRKHIEREFEVGKDEAWFSNIKRTYDEFQQESLESIRQNRTYVQEVLHDSRNHANNLNAVALQAIQNAVDTANIRSKSVVENLDFKAKNILDTANLVNKQAAAHRDIAIDREWNVDEQGYTAADILQSNTFKDGVVAAVVAAVNEALTAKKL